MGAAGRGFSSDNPGIDLHYEDWHFRVCYEACKLQISHNQKLKVKLENRARMLSTRYSQNAATLGRKNRNKQATRILWFLDFFSPIVQNSSALNFVFTCLPACLCMSVSLSVSVCLSVCSSVCLCMSVSLSVWMPVSLSLSLIPSLVQVVSCLISAILPTVLHRHCNGEFQEELLAQVREHCSFGLV